MSYLRCDVRTCTNNQNDYCLCDSIRVNGPAAGKSDETCCACFTQKTETYANAAEHHAKADPETDVCCDACNCSFNRNSHCCAPNVDICGAAACTCEGTQCCTFDPQNGI